MISPVKSKTQQSHLLGFLLWLILVIAHPIHEECGSTIHNEWNNHRPENRKNKILQ